MSENLLRPGGAGRYAWVKPEEKTIIMFVDPRYIAVEALGSVIIPGDIECLVVPVNVPDGVNIMDIVAVIGGDSIRAAERERCAKIADSEAALWDCGYEEPANRIAAKIRSGE